nr:hypothetical protein [Tanacetum cinerariifolium]
FDPLALVEHLTPVECNIELVHVYFKDISSDEKCKIAWSECNSIQNDLKCGSLGVNLRGIHPLHFSISSLFSLGTSSRSSLESKAYKTYLGYAFGVVPPKIARKFKKASPSKKDSSLVPVDDEPAKKGKQVKRSIKKSTTTLATGIVIKEAPVKTQSKRKEKVDVACEDTVSFLRELGYTGEINSLSDVVVDQMHQPWRTFVALINRGLSGKTSDISEEFQSKFESFLHVKLESIESVMLIHRIPELVHVYFKDISSDEKCKIAWSECNSIMNDLKCGSLGVNLRGIHPLHFLISSLFSLGTSSRSSLEKIQEQQSLSLQTDPVISCVGASGELVELLVEQLRFDDSFDTEMYAMVEWMND